MKKKIIYLLSVIGLIGVFLTPATALAAPVNVFPGGSCQGNTKVCGSSGTTSSLFTIIKNVINVLLLAAGIIAVIMIIIGGINYTISSGDNAKVASAKNTVLYAIIGLIVASLSFAVVNFIISNLF